MKRSAPLVRRTPLRATARESRRVPLVRRARIRPVNPARRARLQAEQYGPHAAFIRAQPSAASGRWGTERDPIVAAHASKTRGAGGRSADLIPLLLSEERVFHDVGRETFAAAFELDLAERAAWYADHSPALNPEIARRVDVLPCEDCGEGGPHRAVLLPDGSFVARCTSCRGEAR